MANKPNNPALWSRAKSLAKQKIMDNMAQGGEKMPPEIARARFAAAGNLEQMSNYGYAYGGYLPEMMHGGYDYMAEGGGQPDLPLAQRGAGWVERAANAEFSCRANPRQEERAARASANDAIETTSGGRKDPDRDAKNARWKAQGSQWESQGINKQDFNNAFNDSSRMGNSFMNPDNLRFFDPNTRKIKPEFEQYKNSFAPRLGYYEQVPELQLGQRPNVNQILQHHLSQPQGIEGYRQLIKNDYSGYPSPFIPPAKEIGGESIQYQKGGYIGYDGKHHNNGGHGTYSDGVYFEDGGEEMQRGGQRMAARPSVMAGNNSQKQVMQIVQAYAQKSGVDPKQIMQKLQQMPIQEAQQAIQEMAQDLQNGQMSQGQQMPQEQMQQPPMQGMANGGSFGQMISPAVDYSITAPSFIGYMQTGGMSESDNEYAYGGIHLDPSKRGTFTAAATKHGKSVQGFASQVLGNKDNYSPAMVKKANFARNASKWNHAEGGVVDNYQVGESYDVSPKELNRLKSLGYKIQIQ